MSNTCVRDLYAEPRRKASPVNYTPTPEGQQGTLCTLQQHACCRDQAPYTSHKGKPTVSLENRRSEQETTIGKPDGLGGALAAAPVQHSS
eukprot:scaffold15133_cov58-Phaeocystis_antarctica.AAC.1